MSNNSKINTVETDFMFILVLSADAAEFLATLAIAIPVIGQILPAMAWFYGTAVIMPIIFFWLWFKGVSIRWFLGGSSFEIFPMLNSLPFRTVAIAATIIEDSLPAPIKKVAQMATAPTKAIKATK